MARAKLIKLPYTVTSPKLAKMAKLALLALLVVAQCFSGSAHILLGGATSISATINRLLTQSRPPVKVVYEASGSGLGRKNFIDGCFNIASSDVAFTPAEDAQYCTARGLPSPTAANAGHFTLPYVITKFGVFVSPNTVLGTTAGRSSLSMSAAQLATIYSDSACNWNTIYPGRNVRLVYFVRCDDSGSTKVFTSYLLAYGGKSWSLGTSFSSWPALPACFIPPTESTRYGGCGRPALGSYSMVAGLKNCIATGCITYVQAGYGRGAVGPGETAYVLSEVAIPNRANVRLTSASCLVSQGLPSVPPSNRQNWSALDRRLLSFSMAKLCPLFAVNYMNSRYTYTANPSPKQLLRYLYGIGYRAPLFTNMAAVVIPISYRNRASTAISSITS